jgi:hypothetical protein
MDAIGRLGCEQGNKFRRSADEHSSTELAHNAPRERRSLRASLTCSELRATGLGRA